MYKRRRRSRGIWMPNRGNFIGTPTDTNVSNGLELLVNAPGSGASPNLVTAVFPLTFDFRISDDDFQGTGIRSMADVVGHDWFLNRIVGKVFVCRRSFFDTGTRDDANAILVGAGFLIARANDQGSGGGADTPVASATPAEINDNYSPLELDTVRNPWIWRRTWLLGNQGIQWNTLNAGPGVWRNVNFWPASNVQYGSVADGPHIDAKTKRRVKGGDRLFFALSAHAVNGGDTESTATQCFINCWLDYRLFGSLRRPRNKGSF